MKTMKKILLLLLIAIMSININAQRKVYVDRDMQFNKLDAISVGLDTLMFLDANKLIKRVNYTDFYNKLNIPTLTSDLTNDGDGVNPFLTTSVIPTKTSDLTNDGSNGTDPFITILDLPSSAQLIESNYSVSWTTGLSFDVLASRYFILGIEYNASPTSITLDVADGSNDRIDIIVGNSNGTVTKITGTPAPSPAEPNYDLGSQIPFKFILVKTSATEPSNPNTGETFSKDLVYAEDLGEPAEFTRQSRSGVNYSDAVTTPHLGSLSTQVSNVNTNNYASWKWATDPGFRYTEVTDITFWIKLSEPAQSSLNIGIYLNYHFNGAQTTATENALNYGIDINSTVWQKVVFDISKFPIVSNLEFIDGIAIQPWGVSASSLKINIDDVYINNGSSTPPSSGGGSGSTPDLQSVANAGNVTTTPIEANSFVKTSGTQPQFLKADGTITENIGKVDLKTELKTKVALGNVSGVVNIDVLLGIHYTMNMTGNVTNLTFTNLTNEELKTITLEITSDGGSYTFFQPTSIKGDWSAFDSTLTNQIQIYMYDISTPLFTSGFFNF